MTFASCANSSDSDDGNNIEITDTDNSNNNSNNSNSNSNGNNNNGNNNDDSNNGSGNNNDGNLSSDLPENEGKNPIKETIRLNLDESDRYLELKADGTAFEIYIADDKNSIEETLRKYKYTYDDKKETITMKLEKHYYEGFFEEAEVQLLTYNEMCSKIDEEFTVEKIREIQRKNYEDEKNSADFKKDYPDCDTYEKFETALVKESGFDSFADAVEYEKQIFKNDYKAYFGAQITYAYKIENDKMTLTEKFTGVKNLFCSECEFDEGSSYGDISCNWASINIQDNDRYSGPVDTDEKTIIFKSKKGGEKVNATYTEEIDRGRVTIKFKGKDYVCEFEGEVYTQVE